MEAKAAVYRETPGAVGESRRAGIAGLPNHVVMQGWWAHMADLMLTHPGNEPVATPLPCMSHLD